MQSIIRDNDGPKKYSNDDWYLSELSSIQVPINNINEIIFTVSRQFKKLYMDIS